MAKIEKATKKEDWGRCFLAEAGEIDVMVCSNFELNQIEDAVYNAVDHVEKHDTHVIHMKQETFKDIHTDDMIASIKDIKEVESEQAMSEIIMLVVILMKKEIMKMY